MAEQTKSGRHSPLIFVVAFSLALIAIPSVTRALAQVAALKPLSATELPEVRIISTEFSFTPAQVRVAAGRELTLVLDNHLGETEHKFVLPALGFHLEARAGEITEKHPNHEARRVRLHLRPAWPPRCRHARHANRRRPMSGSPVAGGGGPRRN